MQQSPKVFIDTSFWKALVDVNDEFCERATQTWQTMVDQDQKLITSNYILDETFTLLRYKGGIALAFEFRQMLIEFHEYIEISRVSYEDEVEAWEWFEKQWKKLSFTDCVSFAQMRRLNIQRVASFDQHFTRAGFAVV